MMSDMWLLDFDFVCNKRTHAYYDNFLFKLTDEPLEVSFLQNDMFVLKFKRYEWQILISMEKVDFKFKAEILHRINIIL